MCEAVTSSLTHCSKVICSVSEKRADFGHWKIVDVRAKKQGVAADVCDILCLPAKLYSQTSRNLFPPSFCLCSHSSFINGFLLLRLPSVCSCLDGRCSNTSPSQIKRRLYNSRQHRTHKCNSRAQPLNLFWGHEEGAWIPHGCSRHKTWSQSVGRFAGTVAGNGTSNENIWLKKFVTGRSEVGTIKIKHLGKI